MRILFIHKDFPPGGGVEQVHLRLARQAEKHAALLNELLA